MIFLNSLEIKYDLLPKELNNKKNESQDSNLCPICLDKKNDIHVNPCGHMFCFDCIKKLINRKCPICRADMVGIKEHPEFKFEENIQNIQQPRRYINAIPVVNAIPAVNNNINNNMLNNIGIRERNRRGGIANIYISFSGNIN